jgi:hypothetical protein
MKHRLPKVTTLETFTPHIPLSDVYEILKMAKYVLNIIDIG